LQSDHKKSLAANLLLLAEIIGVAYRYIEEGEALKFDSSTGNRLKLDVKLLALRCTPT